MKTYHAHVWVRGSRVMVSVQANGPMQATQLLRLQYGDALQGYAF
jgi:hypothetical protein